MLESLTGFVVVGVAILVGWIIGRIDLLGEPGRPVLARLTFFVLSPFLLFVVLAQADVRTLFSALLPVSALAAVAVILVYVLVAKLLWRRSTGETVIGALSAGQVNSNNIGIPLSLYLLGSAAYPAPIVDEKQALAQAKDTLYGKRNSPQARAEADAIQDRHGSRKSGLPQTAMRKSRRQPARKAARADNSGQGVLF